MGSSMDGNEVEDSSLSNRRMPGQERRERRVKPGDAGWDSRALKALKGPGRFEIPNSSFFLFFSALCTHQFRSCPYTSWVS
jgi:hypothetical protein